MDEGTAARVRGLVTGSGVLQALDNCSLAAAIVADDNGDGRKELNNSNLLVIEGANSPYGQFVERGHDGEGLYTERVASVS